VEEGEPGAGDVLQLVTGFGPTGAALCRAGVDKVAFTGSGRDRAQGHGGLRENLVPVLMECGGKDAMIVDDGADVVGSRRRRRCGSAMSNAGQTCIGIERVYVADGAYDEFVAEITRRRRRCALVRTRAPRTARSPCPRRSASSSGTSATPWPGAAGALTGGTVDGSFVSPTVLVDVPRTAPRSPRRPSALPSPVTRVPDVEEALRRTNATSYGLAGSVFAQTSKRGYEIARKRALRHDQRQRRRHLRRVPALPFGGIGESGLRPHPR
jgi:acyl-CoA reductase-like NAD-dependent aldehyde dehydrogenase